MRILLLGASGRTGQLVLDYALSLGHDVVALVRDPAKISGKSATSPKLVLVQGTPENPHDVERAMAGVEAVVSTLNNVRTSEFPWSKPLSPTHLMGDSIRNAVAAMQNNGVRRLVVLSATGVGDSVPLYAIVARRLLRDDASVVSRLVYLDAAVTTTTLSGDRLARAEADLTARIAGAIEILEQGEAPPGPDALEEHNELRLLLPADLDRYLARKHEGFERAAASLLPLWAGQ